MKNVHIRCREQHFPKCPHQWDESCVHVQLLTDRQTQTFILLLLKCNIIILIAYDIYIFTRLHLDLCIVTARTHTEGLAGDLNRKLIEQYAVYHLN